MASVRGHWAKAGSISEDPQENKGLRQVQECTDQDSKSHRFDLPGRTQAQMKLFQNTLHSTKTTENKDEHLPKTPGMDNVPRDQSAKGTPERKQPPTPPPKTTFKPAVPKFGNATEIAKDSWITWTGGKPNKDWTGLEDPTPKSVEPNQHRSTSISSQSKSQCSSTLRRF